MLITQKAHPLGNYALQVGLFHFILLSVSVLSFSTLSADHTPGVAFTPGIPYSVTRLDPRAIISGAVVLSHPGSVSRFAVASHVANTPKTITTVGQWFLASFIISLDCLPFSVYILSLTTIGITLHEESKRL